MDGMGYLQTGPFLDHLAVIINSKSKMNWVFLVAGRHIWPAFPFLSDGRLVLSSQGLGQKVGDGTWRYFYTRHQLWDKEHFNARCQFWWLSSSVRKGTTWWQVAWWRRAMVRAAWRRSTGFSSQCQLHLLALCIFWHICSMLRHEPFPFLAESAWLRSGRVLCLMSRVTSLCIKF